MLPVTSTEADIRRVLSLLESTLEATADGILVVGQDGKVSSYNRQFVEMWRIPEQLLASKDDRVLLNWAIEQTKHPARFLGRVRELYGAPDAEAFDSFEMKDGRVFERCSKPQRIGTQVVGRVWSFRDVTKRHRAEQEVRRLNAELEKRVEERTAELAASEERFRSLAETAADAIICADSRGDVVFWNNGAEKMFGYAPTEAFGLPLSIVVPPEGEASYKECLARFAAADHTVKENPVVMSLRRKDGGEFPVELSFAGWKIRDEQYFTAIVRDITARREGEQTLKSSAAQLQASNKELESFSYSVAHDLRAPLRTIDGFSSILAESAASKLDAQSRHFLERIRAAAQQMSSIIDDLLVLSRVTRAEMRRTLVDLSQYARGIAAELKLRQPGRRAVFEIDDGARAWGDPQLLRLVLEHLLGNAWKFSAKAEEARIEFRVERRGSEVLFVVRDNGVGFDPAYAERLFKPFIRLHGGSEFPGTGIGLTIVQRVIQRHGGRVCAEGQPGKGAAFYFTLPETGIPKESP